MHFKDQVDLLCFKSLIDIQTYCICILVLSRETLHLSFYEPLTYVGNAIRILPKICGHQSVHELRNRTLLHYENCPHYIITRA